MSENIVSSFTYPIQHVCCIKKNAGRKRLALVESLHKSKKGICDLGILSIKPLKHAISDFYPLFSPLFKKPLEV